MVSFYIAFLMNVSEPDGCHDFVSIVILFILFIVLIISLVLLLARATFSCRIRATQRGDAWRQRMHGRVSQE